MKHVYFFLLLALVPSLPYAQHFIPFQGKVFDADDNPVTGTHDFRFLINEPGLTWVEDHTGVTVYAGIYAVVLGSQSALPDALFRTSVTHTIEVSMDGAVLDDVVIYKPIETDPGVDESVKDGVSWEEVADRPTVVNVPIGTIVTSILDYPTFLDVNGDPQTDFDVTLSTWAPCDGRSATGSRYGTKVVTLPDLRGLFLRGVNNSGVVGEPATVQGRLNPEATGAGDFQDMMYQSHQHNANMKLGAEPFNASPFAQAGEAAGGTGVNTPTWTSTLLVQPAGGNETRPKNLSVYYYVRIN